MKCKILFDLDDQADCLETACLIATATLLRSPAPAEQSLATVSSVAHTLRAALLMTDEALREKLIEAIEPIAPVTDDERVSRASSDFAFALQTVYAIAIRAGQAPSAVRKSLHDTLDLAIGYQERDQEIRRGTN